MVQDKFQAAIGCASVTKAFIDLDGIAMPVRKTYPAHPQGEIILDKERSGIKADIAPRFKAKASILRKVGIVTNEV